MFKTTISRNKEQLRNKEYVTSKKVDVGHFVKLYSINHISDIDFKVGRKYDTNNKDVTIMFIAKIIKNSILKV